MTQGSGSKFDLDAFATGIERAADAHEVLGAEVDAMPNVWAQKGAPAVTGLLAEALLAVDRMPRRSTTVLRPDAHRALSLVDSAISLSPLYDFERYKAVAKAGSLAVKGTDGILTSTKHSGYFAEHGLGLLRHGIGLSSHCNGVASLTESQKDRESIVEKMKLNGSADPDLSNGLADFRKDEEISEEDYFTGVLELAQRTSKAIETGQIAIEKRNRPSARLRRFIRKRILR